MVSQEQHLHGFHNLSKVTAISHFQRPSIRTDSAEIRRAAGISLGTAPLHPVHLRCHLHCRITWCLSSLLCRRRPTLPHCLAVDQRTAALRLAEGIERVEGWMESNRLKLNSDKTQFLWLGSRQQLQRSTQRPWRSVNTLSNLRLQPRISAWHSTVNWEWTCMPALAAVFISWDSWDPSDDQFPRMPRKHWSIPSYQVVSIIVTVSFTVTQTLSWEDSICPQHRSQVDLDRRKFDHITTVLRDQLLIWFIIILQPDSWIETISYIT